MDALITQYLPFAEKEFLEEIRQYGLFKTLPAHTVLLEEGSSVHVLPVVLRGLIKASSTGEDRDLLLYYIRPGESCVMSFSSYMNHSESKIQAITETETDLLLIPVEKLDGWLRKYPSLNRFLFNLYNLRYMDLLTTIDQLVFSNLEGRLYDYLLTKAENQKNDTLHSTHHEIANDMGTAREVISRTLKKLETSGKIKLGRNEIKLLRM
ncbi:MAG: Crp/Fnr family transcriptional regulator [Bacteroidia bacterium]|nr:Crp/Fnr family transcriptional regulator [Bacteroidia bacterium]